MGDVIGQILPISLGIAVSPVPVVAAILVLLSPRPRGSGVAFLLGWLLGIVVVVWLFVMLSSLIPEHPDDASQPILATVQLAIGLGLVALAVRAWRRRPRPGVEQPNPAWVSMIASVNFPRALVLGFALAAFNPVDLLVSIAAGTAIGSAELSTSETWICIGIFTLVGASTVAVPVVAYLLAEGKVRGPLEHLRAWLMQYNALLTGLVILVVGVALIGKGIGNY
jgi:threonine/homoserine/homoserine lactone efflux protein